MISKTSPALVIKKEDIEQLLLEWSKVPQWVKAHISTRYPAHRYEGELTIEGLCLAFRGRDIKEGEYFEEVIPFDSIIEAFLDCDEHLKSSLDSSFGMGGPVPFIVCYQGGGREQTAYFNTFRSHYPINIANSNLEWYEMLKDMINHTQKRGLGRERVSALVAAGL